ncbi:MAG TPA: nicotinate-nucleotide adenylyltransferase [Candidatus Dormibacteraeota bacterium]
MRLGVLGGTFDPIHVGHVAVARAALDCLDLDRLLVVPARVPPHKAAASAEVSDRLEMCRLAVADLPRTEVVDIEVRREGPSYTAETLEELSEANPGADLRLILGWDAARLLSEWHEPWRVLELARPAIFRRPGVAGPSGQDLESAGIDPERVTVCDADTPDVDATDIRRRAAAGENLAGLVPQPVADYIRDRGLYAGAAGHNSPH